jgi:hypothetical protein
VPAHHGDTVRDRAAASASAGACRGFRGDFGGGLQRTRGHGVDLTGHSARCARIDATLTKAERPRLTATTLRADISRCAGPAFASGCGKAPTPLVVAGIQAQSWGTKPCEARRLEGWMPARSCLWPSFEARVSARSLDEVDDDIDMIRTSETMC